VVVESRQMRLSGFIRHWTLRHSQGALYNKMSVGTIPEPLKVLHIGDLTSIRKSTVIFHYHVFPTTAQFDKTWLKD
jgi:hypothetical protein